MNHHFARFIAVASTLGLLGCAAPAPSGPPADPQANKVPAVGAPADATLLPTVVPKAFTSTQNAPPVQWSTSAPAPVAQLQGPQLFLPSQPAVTLVSLRAQLPARIPLNQAPSCLQPLNQGFVVNTRAVVTPFEAQEGCSYGAIPDLVDYGVYQRLLYYNCASVWVPYILVDDCYYPYAYEPGFLPLWAGNCIYPFFYYANGCYYPYFFHSQDYYYGFLDWEYDWNGFRDRHREDDFQEIEREHVRRYTETDFERWRGDHTSLPQRARDRDDVERASGQIRVPTSEPDTRRESRANLRRLPTDERESRREDAAPARTELRPLRESRASEGRQRTSKPQQAARSERSRAQRPAKVAAPSRGDDD